MPNNDCHRIQTDQTSAHRLETMNAFIAFGVYYFTLFLLLSGQETVAVHDSEATTGAADSGVARKSLKALKSQGSLLDASVKQLDKCNINVCFSLDGSASINPFWYKIQQSFSTRVANAIHERSDDAHFAAVQYGLRDIKLIR